MSAANGHVKRFHDPILARMLATNLGQPSRMLWQRGAQEDPRRNFEDEYGWPVAPGPELYEKLFSGDTIANRVVSLPAWKCWRVDPEIYEVENEDEYTAFEQDVDSSFADLMGDDNYFRPDPQQGGNPFFAQWRSLDIFHRKGRYGVMWYGIDDGEDPRLPPPGFVENESRPIRFDKGAKKFAWVNGKPKRGRPHQYTMNATRRRLRFLKPFPEAMARVVQWEGNRNSPRYLQPVMFHITEIDPNLGYAGMGLPVSQTYVHWTRATIHADVYSNPVAGNGCLAYPALQVPLNDVLDSRKVSGAGPEAYYRAALARLFFETHEQFGPDAIVDEESLADMMEQIDNGFQKHGVLKGLHANQVAPAVTDMTPTLDAKYKRISIHMAEPKRIFEGSERGELSSGQDERQDSENIAARQHRHCSANLLAPGCNRLIALGVYRPPSEEGFKIGWPAVHNANKLEEADIFSKRMAGMASAFQGGVPERMGEKNFWTKEAGFSADEAEDMIAEAEAAALEEERLAQEQAAQMEEQAAAVGAQPAVPPGYEKLQPPQPIKLKPGEQLVHPGGPQ